MMPCRSVSVFSSNYKLTVKSYALLIPVNKITLRTKSNLAARKRRSRGRVNAA